jgi:glutathione S-transferase
MKIYHHPFSSNARKAVMTAYLLDIPAEFVVVDLAKGEQRQPEFLAKNPNGKVPVLEDGELFLWESHAIMAYLGDTKGDSPLYPRDAKKRALVNQWMFWASHHWSPTIGILNFENVLKKMFGQGDPDAGRVAATETQLKQLAAVADEHLSKNAWLCGDTMTLAEVAVACPMMTMAMAKLPLGDYKHLLAWYAKVQELDAWKKTNLPG